jgi:hypothetical protein
MATRQIGTESVHSNYELNDILRQTQGASRGGGFRRVLGAIAGGAANIFMPGIGGIIGGLVGGGAAGFPGLGGESMQYLELMRQMQAETRAFETAVSVSKARHDSSMSAIRAVGSR